MMDRFIRLKFAIMAALFLVAGMATAGLAGNSLLDSSTGTNSHWINVPVHEWYYLDAEWTFNRTAEMFQYRELYSSIDGGAYTFKTQVWTNPWTYTVVNQDECYVAWRDDAWWIFGFEGSGVHDAFCLYYQSP
jgi:hypothetical protein